MVATSSASSRSDRGVKPTRSTNTTLTTLRSGSDCELMGVSSLPLGGSEVFDAADAARSVPPLGLRDRGYCSPLARHAVRACPAARPVTWGRRDRPLHHQVTTRSAL